MSPTSISGGGKLLTGGELISPASLKRKEEALPMAKLDQLRYKKKVPIPERIRTFECQMVTQEGLEPPTLWFVVKYSNPAELQSQFYLKLVDPLVLEPKTCRLWAECSNQLSYGSSRTDRLQTFLCHRTFDFASAIAGLYSPYPVDDTSGYIQLNRTIRATCTSLTVYTQFLPFGYQLVIKRIGAENEARTRDPNLGKVVLYHWATSARLSRLTNTSGIIKALLIFVKKIF